MLYLVIGFIIGCAFSFAIRMVQTKSGVLRIDHSNPEKDVYRFEITDLNQLANKKEIRLVIDNHADLSQE